MLTKKIKFTKINLINFFISFFPLSFLMGNLAININIILVCLLGLAIYRFEIFIVNQKILKYLIYSFFLYIVLITLIRNLPNLNLNDLYKDHIIKSFLFLRFLLLFLVINKLIEKENFNLNLFCLSCAFFSFVFAVDILVQLTFGKDLIGNPRSKDHLSGFFGDELIGGSFVQKFSLFFIFFMFFRFLNRNSFRINFYKISLFSFFLIIIILTGNRVSVLLYLFSVFTFFLIEKKFKEIFLFFLVFLAMIFLSLKYFSITDPQHTNSRYDHRVKNFYYESLEIVLKAPKLFYYGTLPNEEFGGIGRSGYLVHFNSGAQVFKKNKIFGGGLKSFRLNCQYGGDQTCNSHPHNYFLEILVDVGILGMTMIYLIFFLATVNFLKFYNQNLNSRNRFLYIPFFLITFFEFFPIRSSGSFFTTGNAIIIFLLLAILMNITKLDSIKKLQLKSKKQ